MPQQSFKVHLILKKEKINQNGFAPIYVRVRFNRNKIEISSTRTINPQNWKIDKEAAFPATKENKALNEFLQAFKNKVYTAYLSVLSTGNVINAENLRESIFGKPIQKKHTLVETAIEHNEKFEKQIGMKYSKGSYKNYKTTLKYLIEFIPLIYKKPDILLDQMDYKFCEHFFSYLTRHKKCNSNGANKQLQRIKKIVNYSLRLGYISTNPIATYSLHFKPAIKIPLTLAELRMLSSITLKTATLTQVRDVFIFQCYTGLSYGDLKRLKPINLHKGEHGQVWIKMDREKTQISFSVPLLQPAIEILGKYSYENDKSEFIFPVLSNQKMNDNLKVIQEIAGISKNLTTHIGRHTFATTVTLNNDVPIETVSRMLGHTNLRTTQLYAKVLDNKIGSDMDKLRLKLD